MVLKFIGKKYVEIAQQWVGSGLAFGASAGIIVTWASDWKTVLQYLPYYNGKYVKDE